MSKIIGLGVAKNNNQEIEEVLPELVTTQSTGVKTVLSARV